MTRSSLGPEDLVEVMEIFAGALGAHRETINRLNVYPVPDGDTGTNMSLTLDSVLGELRELTEPEAAAVSHAITHGSLMGARGNSGVILCQILRGLAEAFARAGGALGPGELAEAYERSDAAARAGVMRPVEGTILTVASSAARAGASAAAEAGSTLSKVASAAHEAAIEALWATPRQLEVLAQAGVVDAGGAGALLLYGAVRTVVEESGELPGLPLPFEVERIVASGGVAQAPGPVCEEGDSEEGSELRYEVMYLLEAPDSSVPAFKEVWAGLGDSIVVVGGQGLWNCHIHTDDVGGAIEAALDAGRPRSIRVTDLREQVEEEAWVRGAAGGDETTDEAPSSRTSVIAVAKGEGIRRIFHSLGVRHVVAGGQSMNPSTAEILEVLGKVPGHEVVILPNNKNIFAVAEQAAAVAGRPAAVVETAGIQEGFAALLEYDPEASAKENAAAMTAAAERVTAGEVTRAVRASETAAGPVSAGDFIGLTRNGIAAVGKSASDAAIALLQAIVTEDHEIVTIIEGAGSTPAETRRITEWLASARPGVSVELHHGGQPLYPYLVSTE